LWVCRTFFWAAEMHRCPPPPPFLPSSSSITCSHICYMTIAGGETRDTRQQYFEWSDRARQCCRAVYELANHKGAFAGLLSAQNLTRDTGVLACLCSHSGTLQSRDNCLFEFSSLLPIDICFPLPPPRMSGGHIRTKAALESSSHPPISAWSSSLSSFLVNASPPTEARLLEEQTSDGHCHSI